MKVKIFHQVVIIKIFIALLILISCDKDEDNPTGPSKANFFTYGLLGVRPTSSNPDSSHYWVYARVFNHPDYLNVEAQLEHGSAIIPLESDNWESDLYFTEGRLDFSFAPDEEYIFSIHDANNTYGGKIITLPQVEITKDTVIANQIMLEWTNVGADFYSIGLWDYGNFEKHYHVDGTQFTISLDSLPIGYGSTLIDIDVAGFKGFNPKKNSNGNINGCYGYLFGYTYDYTSFDIPSLTFLKPKSKESPPNLDSFILSLLKKNSTTASNYVNLKPAFLFNYGYISNSSYNLSNYGNFYGFTVFEPINSITHYEGYLNDTQLDSYNWSGFGYGLRMLDDVYEYYEKDDLFTFKLFINHELDSASVAIPDTFSILEHPPEYLIPETPFQINWRRPYNADFFFINASWGVAGDSLNKNFLYVTEDNLFTFNEIPDSVVSGWVNVTAISGTSPMKELVPNLKKLNGYYFARRRCRHSLNFYPGSLNKPLSFRNSENRKDLKLNRRIDEFLLSKLSEKYPQLRKYKNQLLLE